MSNQDDKQSWDLFLSHCWAKDELGRNTHERVKRIKVGLQSLGYESWIDEENMIGELSLAMSDGLQNSALVVVFVTKQYMHKVNSNNSGESCYKEFSYAAARKPMLPVVLEPCMLDTMKWDGRFFMEIGNQLYHDFSSDDNFDESIKKLGVVISRKLENTESHPETNSIPSIDLDFDPLSTASYKVKDFMSGTREWIFSAVSDWYTSPKWSRVFVLMGVAGIGKSVFCAELCRRGGALAKVSSSPKRLSSRIISSISRKLPSSKKSITVKVAALHFFKHDDERTSSAFNCLLGVAKQLSEALPGYLAALGPVSIKDIKDQDLKTVFRRLISEPCSKTRVTTKVVVVIDALDECNPLMRKNFLNVLQQCWVKETPNWLGLLVSTRPEDYIPYKLKAFSPTELNTENECNISDMKIYLKALLTPLIVEHELGAAIRLLLERSQGLFLYARFLEDMLKQQQLGGGKLLCLNDLLALKIPDGLDGVYGQYFERFRSEGLNNDGDLYRILLGCVVAAREPLPLAVLQGILALNGYKTTRSAQNVINKAKQLLYVVDGHIRFIHKSMRDWLTDPENLEEDLVIDDLEGAHRTLGNWCYKDRVQPFSFQHAVYHLCLAQEMDKVEQVLLDFTWVAKAVATTPLFELVLDCERFFLSTISNNEHQSARLGVRVLEKAVPAVSYDPLELHSQILTRLPATHPLVLSCRKLHDLAWLRPVRPFSLESANSPLRKILRGHSKANLVMAIHENLLLSASGDSQLLLWDLDTGQIQVRIDLTSTGLGYVRNIKSNGVSCVTLNARFIVCALWDSWIVVFLHNGDRIIQFDYNTTCLCMCFIDECTLACGCRDAGIRLFSCQEGKEGNIGNVWSGVHTEGVWSLASSGNKLVSGGYDIAVWDVDTAKVVRKLEPGHDSWVYRLTFCTHNDREYLISGSADFFVKVWDLDRGGEMVFEVNVGVEAFGVAYASGKLFASCGNSMNIYDFGVSEMVGQITGHSDIVRNIVACGETVVSAGDDRTMRVYSFTKGVLGAQQENTGHSEYIHCVRFSSDGSLIYTGSADRSVGIWSVETGEMIKQLSGHHQAGVFAVAGTPEYLVSGGGYPDNKIVIYDKEYLQVNVLVGHTNTVYDLIMTSSNQILSCSEDASIKLWNYSGEAVRTFVGHKYCVNSLSLSEDGSLLASVANDKTTRVWHVATGENLVVLGNEDTPENKKKRTEGHTKRVRSVSIKGNVLRTASFDGTMIDWSMKTFKVLKRYDIARCSRCFCKFRHDGDDRWDIRNEHCLFLKSKGVGYTVDAKIVSEAVFRNVVALGDGNGNLHILRGEL